MGLTARLEGSDLRFTFQGPETTRPARGSRPSAGEIANSDCDAWEGAVLSRNGNKFPSCEETTVLAVLRVGRVLILLAGSYVYQLHGGN
jgi:hypothetical protein